MHHNGAMRSCSTHKLREDLAALSCDLTARNMLLTQGAGGHVEKHTQLLGPVAFLTRPCVALCGLCCPVSRTDID
jgi:hypothetical protein